jgi:hypothetical protein
MLSIYIVARCHEAMAGAHHQSQHHRPQAVAVDRSSPTSHTPSLHSATWAGQRVSKLNGCSSKLKAIGAGGDLRPDFQGLGREGGAPKVFHRDHRHEKQVSNH